MGHDRRDYARRADGIRRLIQRLLAVEGGVVTADLADGRVSLDGIQRIMRRFAAKSLVRLERNRWVGTPLLKGCPITNDG